MNGPHINHAGCSRFHTPCSVLVIPTKFRPELHCQNQGRSRVIRLAVEWHLVKGMAHRLTKAPGAGIPLALHGSPEALGLDLVMAENPKVQQDPMRPIKEPVKKPFQGIFSQESVPDRPFYELKPVNLILIPEQLNVRNQNLFEIQFFRNKVANAIVLLRLYG